MITKHDLSISWHPKHDTANELSKAFTDSGIPSYLKSIDNGFSVMVEPCNIDPESLAMFVTGFNACKKTIQQAADSIIRDQS